MVSPHSARPSPVSARWACPTPSRVPSVLASADLSGIGLTQAREPGVVAFARAVAGGEVRLDRSVGLDDLVASSPPIPGLGPWTAHYIALRLGEPDAFPASTGVRGSGGSWRPAVTAVCVASPARWRPWRALATAHLWAAFRRGRLSRTGRRRPAAGSRRSGRG